jgi:hypothetical protein
MAIWFRYGEDDVYTGRETVTALRQATARLAKPQSVIVRKAIREYGAPRRKAE